jgi:hypothetical protein
MNRTGTCARCKGVYRTAAQLSQALGPSALAALLSETDGAPPGLKCPTCGVAAHEVAFRGWFIDVCARCHGAFADFGETIARGARPAASRRSVWERLRALLRRKDLHVGKAAPPYGDYALVEALSVPNDRPAKLASHHRTRKGAAYLLEASGVVSVWSMRVEGVDAAYCYARWRVGPVPQPWGHLMVDGKTLHALAGSTVPFEKSHVYRVPFQGTGRCLALHMSDPMADSWSDNSGAITVRLYAKQ